MTRLPIACLLAGLALADAACTQPAPAQQRVAQACSVDAMSPAEKDALYAEYKRVRSRDGEARAEAWIKEQATALRERLAAKGVCPPANVALADAGDDGAPSPSHEGAAPREAASNESQVLNRRGQPCKRVEMENQNVPNVGGSMGWALVAVCKDD